MEKRIFVAAALLAAFACSRVEPAQDEPVLKTDFMVELEADGEMTRAVFDGNKRVAFEKEDALYGAIAKTGSPTQGVAVAEKSGGQATVYGSVFTIQNETAQSPVFRGWFYNIASSDVEDSYRFYGILPRSTVSRAPSDLTGWTVTIPTVQTPTKGSWDGAADPMVIEPMTISYKSGVQNHKVRFAHLFGFGCLTFAGLEPAYSDQIVQSVTIIATGSDKDLAGGFKVDLTKHIKDIVPEPSETAASIRLEGDGTTTLTDFKAWFVANPGTYDVTIKVVTNNATITYKRTGLLIERSAVASPTVNFKDASDDIRTSEVDLSDNTPWVHTMTADKAIRTSAQQIWGDDGKKPMGFRITYSDGGSYYGSYIPKNGKYYQQLAKENFGCDKIQLSSVLPFKGMKKFKVEVGNYTPNVKCKFTIYIKNGSTLTSLKSETVTGSSSTLPGMTIWATASSSTTYGYLVIEASSFSDKNSQPYVGNITINPLPEITLTPSSRTVEASGWFGYIGCEIHGMTDPMPNIKINDSWIEACEYNDVSGKLSCQIAENTTGKQRTGTVTIKAKGVSGETTTTLTFIQKAD